MYDEAQPTPESTSPPAPEGQTGNDKKAGENQGEESGQGGTPAPPAPAPVAQPAEKKPKTPARSPEQKAVDDAIEAHQRTGIAIEVAMRKLAASERAKAIKKGREVVLSRIEKLDTELRQALIDMLPPGSDAEETATQAYLTAVKETAEIEAKKLVGQPKQE